MSLSRHIVLTGFMGTGKSTVGRRLADRLGCAHTDTDEALEAREGRTIPDIFSRNGEAEFRRLEHDIIRETVALSPRVITVGGGAVTVEANRTLLEQSGVLVCLTATPDTILDRIGGDSHRPLLAGEDRRERIETLLKQRREVYQSIPLQVATDGLRPDEVADRIRELTGED